MKLSSINNSFEGADTKGKSVWWNLLQKALSSHSNLRIVVQRFEKGGTFDQECHTDAEEYFYITKGRLEMTISGQIDIYSEGDLAFVGCNVILLEKILRMVKANY